MTNIQYNSGVVDASGCVSSGWALIKNNYWMYLGITFVAYLIVSCIPIANFFLYGPIMVGVYYVLQREMRGEPVEFGMMFKGFEKFVPAMAAGIIQNIPAIIFQIFQLTFDIGRAVLSSRSGRGGRDFGDPDLGPLAAITGAYIVVALAFMVFGIIWHIAFIFVMPLLAEHELGPIEAIKLSAAAAFSNVGGLILLLILEILIAIAGVVALCFGVFFVMPLLYAATAVAYRQVFPDMGPSVYRNVPPAPDVYGGTYGQGQ
jgi:uncharacterized membrane protein